MRKMGKALSRPLPTAKGPRATPGQGGRVSTSAARGRSTTTKRKPKGTTAKGTEQAGHLRRGSSGQPQARKGSQK
ncbi:hypothetical protein [Streptomyces sp. NPDC058424]|uniref:hypothetical protein n=1 Tax=Streptomyces sp. NPDC058424 TaxID=3346491 RepID=UPI0036575CD2